jgi:hypothetical protein
MKGNYRRMKCQKGKEGQLIEVQLREDLLMQGKPKSTQKLRKENVSE